MAFELRYHPDVRRRDLVKIDQRLKRRLARAIAARLATRPERYGSPLRGTLKGYWKLRVGNYRVVFKVVGSEVWIFGIMDRREVYTRIEQRLGE